MFISCREEWDVLNSERIAKFAALQEKEYQIRSQLAQLRKLQEELALLDYELNLAQERFGV